MTKVVTFCVVIYQIDVLAKANSGTDLPSLQWNTHFSYIMNKYKYDEIGYLDFKNEMMNINLYSEYFYIFFYCSVVNNNKILKMILF